MAERSVVRELVTVLGFDVDDKTIAKYQKRIRDVTSRMRRFAISASIFAGAVGFATRQLLFKGEALARTADRLGLTTDALQEWQFAAQDAGIETAQFTAALETFSVRMGMAARGTGPAIEAIGLLGLQVRDANGEVRDMDTLLMEAFERLSTWTNETERGRIATLLFNISGRRLTQMLANGTAGIREMRKRAHELGGVMGRDMLRTTVLAAKRWREFGFRLQAVRNTLAVEFLPKLIEFLERWGQWITDNRELVAWLVKLALGLAIVRIALFGIHAILGLINLLMIPLAAKAALIIAAFALIALLAEDIYLALQGEERTVAFVVFKFLKEKLIELGKLVKGWIKRAQDQVIEWLDTAYEFWSKKWGEWKEAVKAWILDLPNQLISALGALWDWVDEQIDRIIGRIQDALPEWLGGTPLPGQEPTRPEQIAWDLVPPERRAALQMAGATGVSQTNNFIINQAPGETAETVAAAIGRQMQLSEKFLLSTSQMGKLVPE